MGSLILSFEAVMPIFVLMLLGYVLRGIKLADKKTFDAINKLVFKVFLPVLLFYNIYNTQSVTVFDPKLIGFVMVCVVIIFAIGYPTVLLLTKDNAKRGVMLQSFFRSNYAILGVPLADYICKGNSSGLASLMVAIVVPMFNVLAVVALERFRGGNINFRSVAKGILTNPLIIGCIVGAIFLATGLRIPDIVEKSVSDIAKIASPLAIIVLGASFTFSELRGYFKEITIVVLSRLVIVPLIAVGVAVLLGFRGEALVCALIVFASPVAVSSFAMAQQMGGDEKLAAQSVVLTSAFCLLTLFGWIFALDYAGLF